MKVAAIIQARMSSRRLPGKVLMDLGGKPMLRYLIERVQKCMEIDELVVATSEGPDDNEIVRFCDGLGVAAYRGALEDVAWRMVGAAKSVGSDVIVRLSGDSPFLDQATIDLGVNIFKNGGVDLLTNVKPRTFPPGCSVEILTTELLESSYRDMPSLDKEHVVSSLYSMENLVVQNYSSPIDLSNYRLTVDTQAEFDLAQKIIMHMDKPHWSYSIAEVVELGKKIGAFQVERSS